MKDKILMQLIDLRNTVYVFCARLSATMLAPLRDSRLVVAELGNRRFDHNNEYGIEDLSRVHEVPLEQMRDYHIAYMNKDGGQAQDTTGMKRTLQGWLTPALDQIKRDFQENPEMQRFINIIQLFMYVNLDYILDQVLAASVIQRTPLDNILENFSLSAITGCQRLFQEHPPVACHEAELLAIQERAESIRQRLTGQLPLYIDLLEVLQTQYEVTSTDENYDSLIAQYRKENIERQFGRAQDLQRECNAMWQRILDLQAQHKSFISLAATKGMYAVPPTTKFSEEIARLQPVLTIRQRILQQFMEIIKSRTTPHDPESGAVNESYDPNAAYCYGVILLLNSQSHNAAFYLSMFLNEKEHKHRLDYQLKAYYLLYIIFTNNPLKRGQETTLQSYVDMALALETPDALTFGIGHYLGVLHNVAQINNILKRYKEIMEDLPRTTGADKTKPASMRAQLLEQRNAEIMPLIQAITDHCFAAANKGFDFRELVNVIMRSSDTRREVSQVLFNAEMVHDLRNIPPERSTEYARMFLTLVCQDLGQGDSALQHLNRIDLLQIDQTNYSKPIKYVRRRISELNSHNISLELLNSICMQIQGAIDGSEAIYRDSYFYPIFLFQIQKIHETKQKNKDPIDFLTVCHLHLEFLLQHPAATTCDQQLLKSVITQLINIIDREYLIFSADPEKLSNAELRELANKFAALPPIACDCIRELRTQAKYFGGVMAHQCETIAQAEHEAQPTDAPAPLT